MYPQIPRICLLAYGREGRCAERFLRPLAIAVVIVEVFIAIVTIPVFSANLFGRARFFMELATNPLSIQALQITGASLTAGMGILAAIIAAQRGHRPWSIAFVILLVLFAYSPLLLTWVLHSENFIFDAPRFYINTTALAIVALCGHILPAIILAVVVLVYSLRYRRTSSQGLEAA